MGLDLFHLKATLSPAHSDEHFAFREDEIEESVLDGMGFRRFVQTIPDFDFPTKIVILKDHETLDRIRAEDSCLLEGSVDVLIGEPTDLLHRVEQIEEEKGLIPIGKQTCMMTR